MLEEQVYIKTEITELHFRTNVECKLSSYLNLLQCSVLGKSQQALLTE
jgi:hypothetical protein